MDGLLRFAVVTSVILCILGGILVLRPAPEPAPNPEVRLDGWTPPGYPFAASVILAGLSANDNPFALRFFETMTFKGLIRQSTGTTLALFLDDRGQPVLLAPQVTHEGVTVLSAEAHRCMVRVGSTVREFALKKSAN